MASSKRRYNKEEFARRGDALVESKVRPHLTAADEDKFVAVDIETGEYELDKNEMKAVARLRRRIPDPQVWLVHVTLGYLHRFGAGCACHLPIPHHSNISAWHGLPANVPWPSTRSPYLDPAAAVMRII